MVNGASLVAGPIPGHYLDPMAIVRGGGSQVHGYIVVVYGGPVMTFDLIFLRGKSALIGGRLSRSFRYLLPVRIVEEQIVRNRARPELSFYLYDASETIVDQFLATFECWPTITLPLTAGVGRIATKAVAGVEVRDGLLELADMSSTPPVLDLHKFGGDQSLPGAIVVKNHTHLALFDLEANKSHLRELHRLGLRGLPVSGLLIAPEPISQLVGTVAADSVSTSPPVNKDIIDLNAMIREILATGTPSARAGREEREGKPAVKTRTTNQAPPPRKKKPSPAPLLENAGSVDTPSSMPRTVPMSKDPIVVQGENESAKTNEGTSLLQGLYQSFHQQAAPILGSRLRELSEEAERTSQVLHPAFRISSLKDDTAILMLDVIEFVVTHAPMLKRAKLRLLAETLVAELYANNSQALEKAGILSKVEEFYYRLKS